MQRTPFPNNQIPISRESPLAKTLYAATPLPQTADNPLVNSNFNAVNNTTQTVPNITFRLDHVFNQNNRVYFRFTDIDQTAAGAAQLSGEFTGQHCGRRSAGGRDRLPGDPDPDHQRRAGISRTSSRRPSFPRRF